MMRFLIQKINGKIVHDFSFTLLQTIEFKNWLARNNKNERVLIKYFDSTSEAVDFKFKPVQKHYVPVGTVEFVTKFLEHFYGLSPKPRNVPEELFPYADRHIFNGTEAYFSHCGKSFIKSNDKIKGTCGIFNQSETVNLPAGNYQFSSVITIDSEWRAFVYNNKLVGLQCYAGEFTLFPNVDIIKDIIKVYKSAPVAYTLDVGVRKIGDNHNTTFIIEVHDFFSCGLYGFNDIKYLSMLHNWFWQYIQIEMVNQYKNK
jgi:hypothetical protein